MCAPIKHRTIVQSRYKSNTSNNKESSIPEGHNVDVDVDPLSSLTESDLQLAIEAANEGNESEEESIATSNSALNIDDIPGTSKGGSKKLAIIFTCNICETRSAKRFTSQAYNHGVVLVRCPKCESLHLIADRLGYFSDNEDGKGWDIETFMKNIGREDNIKVATEGDQVLEVTLKDIVGDKLENLVETDPEKLK